jgi:excisionase family DNA binding protein
MDNAPQNIQTPDTEPAWSVPQFAHWGGVHPSTVHRQVARGEIPTIKVGKRRRIPARVARALLGLEVAR